MKDKKLSRTDPYRTARLHFSADEKQHLWLPMLLDAYYIIDKGIAEAVKAEARKGRKLACRKGCSSCCKTHQTIPVYPLELVGLSWHVIEKVSGPLRAMIKTRLRQYQEDDTCPFLVEGVCSVHSMRPVACRQFNVFDTPCDEGEDPYYTRRGDVLTPLKKYVDRAFFLMLPFYGVEDENTRWKLIGSGGIHQVVKLLQTCNWKSLAEKMEEFEGRIAERNPIQ